MSLRLCGAGFNFLVAACVGGRSPSLPGVRWSLAGVRRVGVALSHGCGRVSSSSGPCGGLLGLDPRFFSLALVLRCALVRLAMLHHAGLCCVAVRSALSCRAAPCRAVVCHAVAWLAALCCAVPRRVVFWCVVWWGALSWCVARRCTAVRCAVLPRVVPCIAVPWCVVGPFHCRSGVGRGPRWLDGPFLWRGTWAEVMWLAGGLGGAVRCGVGRWIRAAVVRVCRSRRWVRQVSAGLPSMGACVLV